MRGVVGAVLLVGTGLDAVARAIVAPRTQLRVARRSGASPRRRASGRPWPERSSPLIEISQILRVDEHPAGGPVNRNHCRRACDVGTGPVVRRRSTLRMEAHRSTIAQEVVRGVRRARNDTPERVPASHPAKSSRAPLLRRTEPIYRVLATHPIQSLLMAPYEPANAPERRLWRSNADAQNRGEQGGYRDASY